MNISKINENYRLLSIVLVIAILMTVLQLTSLAEGDDFTCESGENCPSKAFDDLVGVYAWAHDGIDYAIKRGLMIGTSETEFSPADTMTRAMTVTLLWRLEGTPEPSGESGFTDLQSGSWYEKAVIWAKESGVVNGVTETTFEPDVKLTRQQLATLFYRYSDYIGLDVSEQSALTPFPDYNDVSDYAKEAFAWAVFKGIIRGNEINGQILIDPNGSATRAQCAVLIKRFIDKTQKYAEDGVLKILTIGNSFSDDVMEYSADIAKSLGENNIYFGNIYGSDLSTNYNRAISGEASFEYRTNTGEGWSTQYNFRLDDALTAQNWDYISFQQSSGNSGLPLTYSSLEDFAGYVRNIVGDAPRFCWHMTWAYQSDCTLWEFVPYNNDQSTMYNAITDCVESVILNSENPEISSMLIIPSGTAIQNARTSFIGDTLTRDGYHLNKEAGRYTAALTLILTLTGLKTDNVGFVPSGIYGSEKRSQSNRQITP